MVRPAFDSNRGAAQKDACSAMSAFFVFFGSKGVLRTSVPRKIDSILGWALPNGQVPAIGFWLVFGGFHLMHAKKKWQQHVWTDRAMFSFVGITSAY